MRPRYTLAMSTLEVVGWTVRAQHLSFCLLSPLSDPIDTHTQDNSSDITHQVHLYTCLEGGGDGGDICSPLKTARVPAREATGHCRQAAIYLSNRACTHFCLPFLIAVVVAVQRECLLLCAAGVLVISRFSRVYRNYNGARTNVRRTGLFFFF